MRPPSGGYQEISSEVFIAQTATHMSPLHSSSPLTPVRLTAQRFTLSLPLPLVQIQMPLLSNELQWQSRTLLSRERRNARRVQRHRGTNRAQQQQGSRCPASNGAYGTYMSDSQMSSQNGETSTDALNQPRVEIESHHSSIDLPSNEICRLTSDMPHGTNFIVTDSINKEADQKCLKQYNFESEQSKMPNENTADVSIREKSSSELLNSSLNPLQVLTVHKMRKPTPATIRITSKLIRHARSNRVPNEQELCCPDCELIPILPVTGQCGHTRCTECIQEKGACSCGAPQPETLFVNVLVQDIISKLVNHCPDSRRQRLLRLRLPREERASSGSSSAIALRSSFPRSKRRVRLLRALAQGAELIRITLDIMEIVPTSMLTRYEIGQKLFILGRYREAAPYLAHVAACSDELAAEAHSLLEQAVTAICGDKMCRWKINDLLRAVRDHSAASWLKSTDLECILCCATFTDPVTTPCGHTYCRTCIERALDYNNKCALCMRSLNLDLSMTRETGFVTAALASIDALNRPPPPDPNVIPIFICTVGYPDIPCPLLMFNRRYWVMVRRVLQSSSRMFGMVAFERDRPYSNYGTILKVCDCVYLEDGCSILSTVGISRFKVIEWDYRDGCEVARVETLTDIIPSQHSITWEMKVTAVQICYKALAWLNGMSKPAFDEIVATLGRMPQMDALDSNWWETPNGPAWIWWLIAILPLRCEIKVLILSTQNLLKRMTAIYRTLDAVDRVNFGSSNADIELQSALNTTEEWLQRNS